MQGCGCGRFHLRERLQGKTEQVARIAECIHERTQMLPSKSYVLGTIPARFHCPDCGTYFAPTVDVDVPEGGTEKAPGQRGSRTYSRTPR